MYLKNLRLHFRLVKICNKKLCSPPQERTVAHASGSECSVLFPCNSVLIRGKCLCLFLFPWLLSFPCNSVLIRGKSSASACSSFRVTASVFSVFFRVRPWQMLILNSVAHASGSERYVAFVFPKPIFYKGLR